MYICVDESDGEEEGGSRSVLGDNSLLGLKAKKKELTTTQDMVNKTRCVCVCVCVCVCL